MAFVVGFSVHLQAFGEWKSAFGLMDGVSFDTISLPLLDRQQYTAYSFC